jgi:hypothetical protein
VQGCASREDLQGDYHSICERLGRVAGRGHQMRNLLFIALVPFVLGGCKSEVDKCVAQWERANPLEGNNYCEKFSSGECMPNSKMSRDEALVRVRMGCMQVSNGR